MTLAPQRKIQLSSLVDQELQLVAPAHRWIDAVLSSCAHPNSTGDRNAGVSASTLSFLAQHLVNGFDRGDPRVGRVPGYTFWMHVRPSQGQIPITMAGSISLRLGDSVDLRCYIGHIGYHVYPPARGHRFAERACKLLLPLARAHGMRELWITANPENVASRRTCERLGGEMAEIVDLPTNHSLYFRGERKKCRYRIDLTR